jgi:Ca2+-binding EF-hand superfamily protein
MKLLTTFLALSFTAGLAGSSGLAHADRDGLRGRHGGDPVGRVMERFDVNRDGVLDRNEVAQMQAAHKQKRQARNVERRQRLFSRALARFDQNRDGRLGPQEVPAELARRMARFDRNGDGWVDAGEVTQPPARGFSAPPQP